MAACFEQFASLQLYDVSTSSIARTPPDSYGPIKGCELRTLDREDSPQEVPVAEFLPAAEMRP